MKIAKPSFKKNYLVVGVGYIEKSQEDNLAVKATTESWQNNSEDMQFSG